MVERMASARETGEGRAVGTSGAPGAPRDLLGSFRSLPLFRGRRPAAGTAAGQLVVPPGGAATRLRVMSFDADRVEEHDLADPEDLRPLLAGNGVTWVDAHGFGDEALLHRLRDVLDLHPLAMADVVNVPQRPKAERYADRLLVIMRMARLTEAGDVELEQVSVVLGPGFVVTFQEEAGDVFEGVRARIRAPSSRIRGMGADFLTYTLLDAIIDGYFPVVESCGAALDELEEEIVGAQSPDALSRAHAARRLLMSLHQLQWGQRDAIAALLREESDMFSEAVRPYLRDIHDHAMQTLDAIENFREMCVGLVELHLSSVSNRLNEVMKTLTVVASIFIPLTFIAGVYGMNFEHMPELRWAWGYPAVWGIMLAVVVGMIASFRRRGWLAWRSRSERDS